MKQILLAFLLITTTVYAAPPQTMRVDYFHTGDANHEVFSLDRVVIEPLPWPGNLDKSVDDTNLGRYLFEVIDRRTNRAIYSRGFASVYGEWETTDEARKMHRTFHESFRLPEPQQEVQILLKKRDANNAFKEIWSLLVDPKDMFVDRSKHKSPAPLLELEKNGDPSTKVDFLILGDGYTAAEASKFEKDAKRLAEILFSQSPFKEHRKDFNVWGLCPPAEESGISRPSTGVHKRNPVGSTYDAFGSERYILTFQNQAFREIVAFSPYEYVEILVNNSTYGGGGIFNLYSTVAADSLWAPYVFVHEFGHHFAGLADEYYTSDVAYLPSEDRVEPWEPNATALLDAEQLKWHDLVSPGTPLPTPWNKEAFEKYSAQIRERRRKIRAENKSEEEMDKLFQEQKEHESRELAADKYAKKVGAFEGANYAARGYYRPQVDCIMFSRNDVPFCAVCRRALEMVIRLYTP
ncbi:IgA Peptidase M64 [bacterium]|nr:IgA Peptidase M64 [bacterium]